MPKIKGKIESTGESSFTKKDGSQGKRWYVKVPGVEKNISGFGEMPDEIRSAASSGQEIEIEYHQKGDFLNYGPEQQKKGGWGSPKKTDPEQYDQMMRMSVLKFLGMLQTGAPGEFDDKNEKCKQAFDYWYDKMKGTQPDKKEDAEAFM